MKKLAVYILTFLYIVSTAGVFGNNFYCCGKFKETNVFSHSYGSGDCSNDKTDKSCCVYKPFFVKVKDNHSPTSELKINILEFNGLPQIHADLFYNQRTAFDAVSCAFEHGPPQNVVPELFLANCVFLI
ncbi:MAG: hypothetical protein WCL14_11915 [Bacteroidota bacterium]